MTRILAAIFALSAAACASAESRLTPEAAAVLSAPERRDALPAQTLVRGECGLFLFELRAPNSFVLFENETARRVKILDDGLVVELGVPPQASVMVPGERFRRVYLDQGSNTTYALTGRVGEATGDDQQLEDVILRARLLDGTETVTPLGGVRRCVTRRAG
ncbi:MAG: hypothetical protein RKE49_08010 [Oceanicaulis sp.]